jgi:non-homologous end joining protein Ku
LTRCATPTTISTTSDRRRTPTWCIAARIISQDAAFDPTQFKDRYDEALKAMIKAKQRVRA